MKNLPIKNPTVTEVISLFLNRKKAAFNGDLVARYHRGMECQVLVKVGEPIEKGRQLYCEDGMTWYPIHVPKDADSVPKWKDYPVRFPLEGYATDIGMSGWEWERQVSFWVGFDLDSILGGHAEGLTPERLDEVVAALQKLPYVEVRRSTGGKGFHIYVFLADIPTVNHVEHAVLAKAVLAKISTDAGRDFSADVDCFGAILFCWSTRASEEKRSFEQIKPSTQILTETDLPGWRNAVLPPKTRKPQGNVDEAEAEEWDELSSALAVVPADGEHQRVLEEYQARGWPLEWLAEHNCYRVHTAGLKEVKEGAQPAGYL